MASGDHTGGPDERLSVVDGLVRLSYLVQRVIDEVCADLEISTAQGRLLGVLHDRTPTMADLSRVMGLEKSTVTGLIDRAERRGLVERTASPSDRRSTLIALTGEGLLLARRFRRGVTTRLAAETSRLSTADRDELARLTTAIVLAARPESLAVAR